MGITLAAALALAASLSALGMGQGAVLLAVLACLCGGAWLTWQASRLRAVIAAPGLPWHFRVGTRWQEFEILAARRGPGCLSLRAVPVAAGDPALPRMGRPRSLTIWQDALRPADWRRLCVLVQWQAARRPGLGQQGEIS